MSFSPQGKSIEFLKSIVQRSFVAYSVKERRWVYDDVAVEMVQISEGVVDFLTKRLKQLPRNVIEALEVCSLMQLTCAVFYTSANRTLPIKKGRILLWLSNKRLYYTTSWTIMAKHVGSS